MNDTLILYFFLCFKYLNTCRNKGVGLFHSTRDKNILKMRITNKIKMKKGPVVYILSYSDERSGLGICMVTQISQLQYIYTNSLWL